MEIGDPIERDCFIREIQHGPSVLQQLVGCNVTVDELDYLAKRLDSFDDREMAKFQGAAVSCGCHGIVDLINLTFSCQQVTIITDFTDLDEIGQIHYMVLNGGTARLEDLASLDGRKMALALIEGGGGRVTPYGVVYENGMKLTQVYDGRHFPEYFYENCLASVLLSLPDRPMERETLYFPCTERKIARAIRRLGVERPEQCVAMLDTSEISEHPGGRRPFWGPGLCSISGVKVGNPFDHGPKSVGEANESEFLAKEKSQYEDGRRVILKRRLKIYGE